MKKKDTAIAENAKVSVALIQANFAAGDVGGNLDKMERLTEKAARGGAKWIQFPELCVCDYVDDPAACAEAVPGGRSTARMTRLAEHLGAIVIFGLAEKDLGRIYDSAVFAGPGEYLYHYRKTWLWHEPSDRDYRDEWARYDPGTGPEAFRVGGVRATCFICADSNSKRCVDRAAKLKPQVVFFPINRHNVSSFEDYARIARTIGAPMLVSNRVGQSVSKQTLGGSVVFSAQGEIVARANMRGREEILHYDLEIAAA